MIELLTGSQRRINYVAIPPLLDSNLGKNECEILYEKILKKSKNRSEF